MTERYLIVNADDFGLSFGINRGVIRAHEEGIVTSASLMVRYPAAAEASSYARKHQNLSVGLHLDLGEWVQRDWNWFPAYEVVPLDDLAAIQREFARQLATFCLLTGQMPTHIDSHQHVHQREPVRAVVKAETARFGIPLRACNPQIQYCGRFYGQTTDGSAYPDGITADTLIHVLAGLPAGYTELGCHPGEADGLNNPYRLERVEEVRTLCDPRVRSAVTELGVRLCSFAEISLSASARGGA